MKQQITLKRFLLIFIILIGFVFLSILSNKPSSNGPDKIEACLLSRKMVKEMLKAPSTAKFGDCAGFVTKEDIVIITSYVDAQNSFGAMLRNKYAWHGKYDKKTNKWDIIYFAIAGEIYINKYKQ